MCVCLFHFCFLILFFFHFIFSSCSFLVFLICCSFNSFTSFFHVSLFSSIKSSHSHILPLLIFSSHFLSILIPNSSVVPEFVSSRSCITFAFCSSVLIPPHYSFVSSSRIKSDVPESVSYCRIWSAVPVWYLPLSRSSSVSSPRIQSVQSAVQIF